MLRLYTFGGLRIERDGTPLRLPTRKARDLLAYLVTFRDRAHPRAALVGVLWPRLPEDKARRRLSDSLWRIRHVVGTDIVLADENTLRLNLNTGLRLDVARFEVLVGRSPGARNPLPALREAIALYSGPYLDGLYHDWCLVERERLRGLYIESLNRLLKQLEQAGDAAAALEIARQLVATEPLHEGGHRELMRLYHLLDRDAEAMAQYHRCREILQQELGVEPTPKTTALYHTLSRRATLETHTPAAHLPSPARRIPFDLDEPPLVGRESTRAALLSHLEAAAAGRGGMVLLEGEAGIGKSRLAQELAAGARWRNVSVIVGQAGAASYTAPILEGIAAGLTPLRIRQLAHLMTRSQLQLLSPLLPPLAQALPETVPLPELSPPQAHEQLQHALCTLVLSLAHITPHLWVLEDLQWADAETLALLPRLLPHLERSRSLFLLTVRSAELRANAATWDTLQSLDRSGPLPRYTLDRLDAGAIASLIHQLLDEDAPHVAHLLARESEGVPLYLVETLKAWRDEGHLRHDVRTGWQWAGDEEVSPSSRPGQAIIDHRLARLSPAAGEVLATAAVIGTAVDFDLLAETCAPPENVSHPTADSPSDPRLLAATEELLRLGFLIETEAGYHFSHERVRQAVYQCLAPSRRTHLHRRVAHALEVLDPRQFELLAHHFQAGDERIPAIHYLRRAARRARELFAHRTTVSFYDQLLDLLSHPEERPARYDVLRKRIEVLGWIGDREEQERDLEQLFELARDLHDDARLAEALRLRGEWHRVQGQYEAANENGQAALRLYRELGDDRAQADLLGQLGWNVVYTAAYDQAGDYLQEALSIYRDLDDVEGQIDCLIGLANVADLEGHHALTISYSRQCMELAEASGDPRQRARALLNLGLNDYDLGNIETAEAHLRQALRLSESTGDRRQQAAIHFYLGEAPTEVGGDLSAAREHLETARAIFREVQDVSWEGDTLAALGRLAILEGDLETAKEHLRAAYERRRELGEPAYAAIDLSYLALAESLSGEDGPDAWQHSREAVAELEAGLTGVEHPQSIYYNHFRVAQATRHWAAARAALEKAAHIVDERAAQIDTAALRASYRTGLRVNRAITGAAARLPPPGRLRIRLVRPDAPSHRRPTPAERISLTWTVDAGDEDAALGRREGKVALRRRRILRLMAEAEAAGALPAVADLAGALNVSVRTLQADLAALRRQGQRVRTRGR
jgi:DNA-binding SARP family transcriptional activator/predicted ATPase